MYFPILRGRQNELLAIRELQEEEKLTRVTPIIEPVRASSTLLSVLKQFKNAEKELLIVGNPIVGSFEKELSQNPNYRKELLEILSNNNFIEMLYCKKSGKSLFETLNLKKAYTLTADSKQPYQAICDKESPRYTIIPSGGGRLHRMAKGGLIILESEFRPQSRNADYIKHDDDYLTEEPFFYKEEGYLGFSDYSVIGEDYNEGGFTPKVVALHLAYKNENEKQIGVKHFTSSEDDYTSNTAGKFDRALDSLILWANQHNEFVGNTLALQELKTIKNEERFPGLGYAKKLAIKHHLELINTYLEDEL